jgi:hypothetical protein
MFRPKNGHHQGVHTKLYKIPKLFLADAPNMRNVNILKYVETYNVRLDVSLKFLY